jgi:hypothetical protein
VATKCEKAKDKIKKISVKNNVRMMICDAIDEIRVETQDELRVVVDEIAENNKNEITSNFEKLLQNYKNESDKKTEEQKIENNNLKIQFEGLQSELRIVNRDNMNILKTLRTRQLIDAGRNFFYTQYGGEYELKCPDAVYNHPATGKSPKSWTDFVNFASNKKRHGQASFWHLLKGGDYSVFSNVSIYRTDRYEIAQYFKRVGKAQGDYGVLFEEIFNSTVNEVYSN